MRPPQQQFGGFSVDLTLTDSGAADFEVVTGENVGRQLAIVLDGRVFSAPRLNERIGGGRAQISGNFDPAEARDLAIVLRAGALVRVLRTHCPSKCCAVTHCS